MTGYGHECVNCLKKKEALEEGLEKGMARLIPGIPDLSNQPMTVLSEEPEMLRSYIEPEQLHFEMFRFSR